MTTWEKFKKKMFKKNKDFEKDFKEIERRIEMENLKEANEEIERLKDEIKK